MHRWPSLWALCSVALVAGWLGAFATQDGLASLGVVVGVLAGALGAIAWTRGRTGDTDTQPRRAAEQEPSAQKNSEDMVGETTASMRTKPVRPVADRQTAHRSGAMPAVDARARVSSVGRGGQFHTPARGMMKAPEESERRPLADRVRSARPSTNGHAAAPVEHAVSSRAELLASASESGNARDPFLDELPGADPEADWSLVESGDANPVEIVIPSTRDERWMYSIEADEGDWEWNLATGHVRTASRWRGLVADTAIPVSPGDGPEEILGRLDSSSRESLLATLARALSTPAERKDTVLNVRTDSGSVQTIRVQLSAITDASGDFSRVRARFEAAAREDESAASLDALGAEIDAWELPEHLTDPAPYVRNPGLARSDDSMPASTSQPGAFAERVAEDAALFNDAFSAAGMAVATLDGNADVVLATESLRALVAAWGRVEAWWEDALPRLRPLGEARGPRQLEMEAPTGQTHTFEITVSFDGRRGVAVALDVTEQARTAVSLAESQARFAVAAKVAHGGLWDWDLRTGHVYYSPRWSESLGLDPRNVVGNPDTWLARIHPEEASHVRAVLDEETHKDTPSASFEVECRVLHTDGTYRWMRIRGTVVRDDGGPRRVAGSMADISAHKRTEQQLVHGTLYDALTGLPNRSTFRDMVAAAIKRMARVSDANFAVLVLDLDGLQLVNQSLGHQAGDSLLRAFSERLNEGLRQVDSVSRLSGNAFGVLLTECSMVTEAQIVAERIQSSLNRAFTVGDTTTYVTAALGIVMNDGRYDDAEALLRDGETAMAEAKTGTGAGPVVFDASMHTRSRSLLQLQTDLRGALEREELELQYQPIVSLQTGQVAGFEALVRWRHPERGLVWPETFISVAEDTGLIDALSEWVLRRACRQLADWDASGDQARAVSMSVNLSSSSFDSYDIVALVRDVLEETGVAPSRLRLEVTESVLVEHGRAADVLTALRDLGVQLYLDDFGTGYSSLSYLHKFQVDALKIDRSFVAKMTEDEQPNEIVVAITTLAHNLGLQVIAEGIQTPSQLARLRAMGCAFGQGYMFARPLDAAYAQALLEEDPVWT